MKRICKNMARNQVSGQRKTLTGRAAVHILTKYREACMFKSCGRIAAFFFCTALANVMWGQGTRATITGIIQDRTGAAIPAAELTLRSLATSALVKASSGADGFYNFPGLVAGGDDLPVAGQGFRRDNQPGSPVHLGQQGRIDATLALWAPTPAVGGSPHAPP